MVTARCPNEVPGVHPAVEPGPTLRVRIRRGVVFGLLLGLVPLVASGIVSFGLGWNPYGPVGFVLIPAVILAPILLVFQGEWREPDMPFLVRMFPWLIASVFVPSFGLSAALVGWLGSGVGLPPWTGWPLAGCAWGILIAWVEDWLEAEVAE